jgi:hypothetical protein
MARNKNNLFGALDDNGEGITYSSKKESIYRFGKFMKSLYIDQGLITLEKINPKYCPPNPDWKIGVRSYIDDSMKKLKK